MGFTVHSRTLPTSNKNTINKNTDFKHANAFNYPFKFRGTYD